MAEKDKEKEYEFTKETKTELQAKLKEEDVPVYFETIELTADQKKRLLEEVRDEFQAIKDERQEDGLDNRLDALDRQAEGKLPEDEARQFNLTLRLTSTHEDRIVNNIMEAFLDQEPRYNITPRPGFEKAGGREVCEKQSDFLDDRIDYLNFRAEAEKAVRSSVRKYVGFLKVYHHIQRDNRKREEEYQGSPILTGKIDPKTNKPIIQNKGLEQFLENWPNAAKDYPRYVVKLQKGEKINFIAKYKETTYNDAKFRHVDNKNFYARLATDGYEGLKVTRLTVERVEWSYWELKRAEQKKQFSDVDELIYDFKGEKKDKQKGYKNKSYNILECVYYFKMKEEDDEEVKIVCWIAEEKWIVIGAIYWPYFSIDCSYVPLYVKHTKSGLYQASIDEDITDDEYASAIFLNSTLEGVYFSNLVTPITEENSDVDIQFTEKKFLQGMPINAKPGEIDFLQKYMKPTSANEMLSILQYMKQGVSDKTGVSPSIISGAADPLDPSAPLGKTKLLLQQSNKFMRSYIYAIGPGFAQIGDILLQMYYQIAKEGRKYNLRRAREANSMPFAEISRSELAAKTIIEVRAYQFDFDKQNEKQLDIAFYQMFRQELLVAGDPESVHYLLKTLGKSWSPKWKNTIDMILPSLQEIKQRKIQVTMQAIAMYVQQKEQDAKITGQPVEYNTEELMKVASELQKQIATPPSPEEIKAAEKGNK